MSLLIGIHYIKYFILEGIVNGFQIRQRCPLGQEISFDPNYQFAKEELEEDF